MPPVSDVAVVLGGMADPVMSNAEHIEFSRASERIVEAVALYREGRVKAVLITSGSGDLTNQVDKEAPYLEAWALAAGVKASDLVIESESRNTHENATMSLPLANAKGYKSFVLVTSASHMPRSAAIFRKAGYDKEGRSMSLWAVDTQQSRVTLPFGAIADPNCLAVVQSVLREMLGYAVYAVQGYL